MKRLVIMILALVICVGTPALATPTVEFSPNPDTGGSWEYDGASILSFNQNIAVDAGMGSNYDALTGSLVHIPTLIVGAGAGGTYEVKPIGSPTISITSADNSAVYLMGTLAGGDLVPIGTIAGGYTCFKADISNLLVTDAGKALGGALVELMHELGLPNGLSAVGYTSDDIPALVDGTLPQHRVINLSPRPAGAAELASLFEKSMTLW